MYMYRGFCAVHAVQFGPSFAIVLGSRVQSWSAARVRHVCVRHCGEDATRSIYICIISYIYIHAHTQIASVVMDMCRRYGECATMGRACDQCTNSIDMVWQCAYMINSRTRRMGHKRQNRVGVYTIIVVYGGESTHVLGWW